MTDNSELLPDEIMVGKFIEVPGGDKQAIAVPADGRSYSDGKEWGEKYIRADRAKQAADAVNIEALAATYALQAAFKMGGKESPYKNELFDLIRAALESNAPVTGDTSDGYHTFNELYEHRHILFFGVLMANKERAWRSKLHADGTMYDGWFVAGIDTDLGQATYHLPIRMWGLFDSIHEHEKAPKWDGHTSNDTLVRIREHAKNGTQKAPRKKPWRSQRGG